MRKRKQQRKRSANITPLMREVIKLCVGLIGIKRTMEMTGYSLTPIRNVVNPRITHEP